MSYHSVMVMDMHELNAFFEATIDVRELAINDNIFANYVLARMINAAVFAPEELPDTSPTIDLRDKSVSSLEKFETPEQVADRIANQHAAQTGAFLDKYLPMLRG